jgi:hypothetical protein
MAANRMFPQVALLARRSHAAGEFRPLAIACFAILPIVTCQSARSEESSTQVWVNPGFYSQHFKSSGSFRSDNWGVGAELALSPEHAALTGSFINSDGRRSQYGAYWWRPVHWKYNDVGVHAGVVAAALDGYPNYRSGGWFVAPIPALAIEGGRVGANVMVVPTIKNRVQGAIAVQLKIRVW